jgi:hypothetical protein
MARNHARILTSIWDNDDFLGLEPEAQRVYLLLVSQPDLSPCGALPYLPGRWSRLSCSTGEQEIVEAVELLVAARFVVVDHDTQELVVRTFVVHDGGLGNPKMRGAVKSALKALHSRRLRAEVAAVLPEEHRAGIVDGLSIEWQSNGDPELGTSAMRLNAEVGGRRQEPVSSTTSEDTSAEQAESVDLALVAAEPPPIDPVVMIFDTWRETTSHRKAVLDKKRRQVIDRALKHYPLEDCLAAVQGVMLFPHNRGETNGQRYDDVALILRDSEHVERFRDAWNERPASIEELAEPPSGPTFVADREQSRRVDTRPCAVGNEFCRNGIVFHPDDPPGHPGSTCECQHHAESA